MSLLSKLKSHYVIICSNCDLNIYFETTVLGTSYHKVYCINRNRQGGFPFVPTQGIVTEKAVHINVRPYSISQ